MSLVFVYAPKPWLSKNSFTQNLGYLQRCVTARVLLTLNTVWNPCLSDGSCFCSGSSDHWGFGDLYAIFSLFNFCSRITSISVLLSMVETHAMLSESYSCSTIFVPAYFKKPTLNKALDFLSSLVFWGSATKGNDAALHLETCFLAWLYSWLCNLKQALGSESVVAIHLSMQETWVNSWSGKIHMLWSK